MIARFELENFKGIRDPVPLDPITLLFGANSSGKSTVSRAHCDALEVALPGSQFPAFCTRYSTATTGFDGCGKHAFAAGPDMRDRGPEP